MHDSGSGWFATPFLYDSFIHNSTPVYPGALRSLLDVFLGNSDLNRSRDLKIAISFKTNGDKGSKTTLSKAQNPQSCFGPAACQTLIVLPMNPVKLKPV